MQWFILVLIVIAVILKIKHNVDKTKAEVEAIQRKINREREAKARAESQRQLRYSSSNSRPAIGDYSSSGYGTYVDELGEHDEYFRKMNELNAEYAHTMQRHEQLMEQIGAAYAIVNELKTPDSPEMEQVIALAKEDIALAPIVREYWIKYDKLDNSNGHGHGDYAPKHYPTFSRLAIIYEKRKEYQKALDVCSQAISLGFTSDRTEGGMVGRAARLTRKLNQENARVANPDPVVVVETPDAPDGVVTTSTELECFAIVKTLLHDAIDISRISYKDTKSYFSVIVDGKTSKWVCRLRVEGKTKTITIPDETGKEIRHTINSVDDIINYKEVLLGRIAQINQ